MTEIPKQIGVAKALYIQGFIYPRLERKAFTFKNISRTPRPFTIDRRFKKISIFFVDIKRTHDELKMTTQRSSGT